MFKKFTIVLIFCIIFFSIGTISSKTIKIKCMPKKINSGKNKLQFLNVDNFEIILKFLNFDDLPSFLSACEKSKSNYLRQTSRKLFQKFRKNQIQTSIEYVSSEMLLAPKPKSTTKFFGKYLNLKTISLPKFMQHIIQTPKFRIVSHVDGFFSIEKKLDNQQKQYSMIKIKHLFFQHYSTEINYIKLLNLIFSSKNFITSILNHENNIFIIFEQGQIFICGKTGRVRWYCQPTISRFISGNTAYFMSYFEENNDSVVYHIASGEIFCFKNSSLKSLFLHSNSKVDYTFLKNNGKSSGFVNDDLSKNFIPQLNEILNKTDNI